MMNTVHAALPHPPMSWRRNTSTSAVIAIQIQITQAKKMIIVQRTSKEREVGFRYEHLLSSKAVVVAAGILYPLPPR
jgi:hypothetical protein